MAHRVSARRLDLQHVGAQGHQQRGGVRPGTPDAQVEHPEPGEERRRRCHRARVLQRAAGSLASVLGFFSFTEVTDPSAHEAYNAWHQLDHLPEQFTIDGISFGRRWVRSPRCRAAESATGSLLERFHYMTLYLLRDEQRGARVLRPGRAAARRGPFLRGAACPLVGPLSPWSGAGPPPGWPSPPGRFRSAPPRGSTWSWARPCRRRRAGGPRRSGRCLAVRRRRARPDHHRRPSSTATCGRPPPPSEPVAARAPNGPGPWSELMPSAGTGSLR